MEAEALPPWPQAAAASETRFRFRGEVTLSVVVKLSDEPSTVRLRGGLVLSHVSRRVEPRGPPVDVTNHNQAVRKLDLQFEIRDHAVFQSSKVCSELIRDMLATAVESEYNKLPADAADSIQTPVDLAATGIVEHVGREIDEIVAAGGVVPCYELEQEIPLVSATGVVALCGRKRRRDREPDGVCAICLLDLETEDEEKVRLPCSHAFHTPCIEPWFDKASTCPTCRLDIMECFSFLRSAAPRSRR
ncbi:hypothetical protein VPH35_055260 [Triticum aestivum]